jgi:predicted tellurium resistance membrane protein TerC
MALDPQIWIGLLTLTTLEIVLGDRQHRFISILVGRLPTDLQNRARQWGQQAGQYQPN